MSSDDVSSFSSSVSSESSEASSSETSSVSSEAAVNMGTSYLLVAIHQIVVGGTVDIAQYLVLTPSDASWTYALGETDAVTAEGTVLTAVFPGTFSLTLSAGGKETTLEGSVISQEMSDLDDFDAENGLGSCTNYLVDFYHEDALIAKAYHNDSFVYRKSFDGSFVNGGYLVSMNDESCYSFTADENNAPTIGETVENGLQFNKLGDAFPFTRTDFVDLPSTDDGKKTTQIAIVNRSVAIPACTQYLIGVDSSSFMTPDTLKVSYNSENGSVSFAFYGSGVHLGYSFVMSYFQKVNVMNFPEVSSIWNWMINN